MSIEIFLLGTLDSASPLRLFRGQQDILRLICTLVCEERWFLHIDRFPHLKEIPVLTQAYRRRSRANNNNVYGHYNDDESVVRWYPVERLRAAGCAIATIAEDVEFPPISSLPADTIPNQQDDILYINMMPINLKNLNSLPKFCKPYIPLIQSCLAMVSPFERGVGYLSIDERPTPPGASQRREGVHVESAGVLPVSDSDTVIRSGNFVPGIEHGWGGGLMTREEYVEGGIFLGSNIANTTAVWNCRIRNDDGDIIEPHGSIKRLQTLLGPPTRTLRAGEIVWMTDKTPHESLPLPSNSQRRQFFRLVIGKVTAWFADHSTPNPTGYLPPPEVRIVHGNKYALYNSTTCRRLWIPGTRESLSTLKNKKEVREVLHEFGLGHLADWFTNRRFPSLQSFIEEVQQMKLIPVEKDDIIDYLWVCFRQDHDNAPEGLEVPNLYSYEVNTFSKIMECAYEAHDHFFLNQGEEGSNMELMVAHFKELLKF